MQTTRSYSRPGSPVSASTTSDTQPPVTLACASDEVTMPRTSAPRQKDAQVFSRSSFSPSRPLDADDFEFAFTSPSSPTRTLRGSKVATGNDALARPTHGLSLQSEGSREMSEGTGFSSDGATLPNIAISYPRSPQRSAPDTFKPLNSASPQVSTLRRKGAEVLSGSWFSSFNPWDADEDEFEPMETALVSPDSTIRGNPSKAIHVRMRSSDILPQKSIQNNNRQSRHETADPFPTLTGNFHKVDLLEQFGNLALSLEKTLRSNLLALQRDTPEKSTRCSSSRSTPGMWDKPAHDMLEKDTKQENKSIWDADDDEFENWPGQDTLSNLAMKFTLTHDRLKVSTCPESSSAMRFNQSGTVTMGEKIASELPICSANLTAQEYDDLMDELADRSCGNPCGADAHDQVMQQFFSDCCKALPASRPSRYMHILNWEDYLESKDSIVQSAFPRLCDAIATVLFLTNPNCLQDFLNPNVKVFEWRRDGHCLLIRRDGNKVIVGTFLNLATLYRWGFYVRCIISDDGKWTETYAAVTQGTTPVTIEGVQFDHFAAEPGRDDISPSDPKWALHVGREMAFFLLNRQVWNFRTWFRWKLEWETDGVVSNAKERERDLCRRPDVPEVADD